MKEKLKKFLRFLLGTLIFLTLLWLGARYYFFSIPEKVTMNAYESLIIGNELFPSFSTENVYMQSFMESKSTFIRFQKSTDKSECLYAHLDRKSTKARLSFSLVGYGKDVIWHGEREDLSEALKKEAVRIKSCDQVCAIFMPTFLYRGSFCFSFDQNFKITKIEEPRFWD